MSVYEDKCVYYLQNSFFIMQDGELSNKIKLKKLQVVFNNITNF